MTKEELIKEAWGHYYNPHIDNDGWFDMKYYDYVFYNDYPKELWDLKNAKLRPKSLQGIEDNEGWIKIESESDLPKDDCSCEVMYQDGTWSIDIFYKSNSNFKSNHCRHITHYKPIVQSKPPLY